MEDFLFTPDGATVVYRADHQTDDALELFRVAIDGSRAIRKLNTKLVAGGEVLEYAVTSDGSRVLYLADQDVDEVVELYLSFLDPDPVHLGRSASPSATVEHGR